MSARRVPLAVAAVLVGTTIAIAPRLAGAGAPSRVFPVIGRVAYGAGHSRYPATDIIAACGLAVVSPVRGRVLEVNRTDRWRRGVDDPATRGGRSVAILGVDGVRYYLAHLGTVRSSLRAGSPVRPGSALGSVGRTGRAGSCHVHFGLSPNCGRRGEWWVRRGVVPPYRHLRAWQKGAESDPSGAVRAWRTRHPDACRRPEMIGAT